jgi:hypothetical protein
LYNYRPQKSDELELSSGEHFKVLEKKADGWFKGFPVLGRQQVGYFPGNYVRPVRYVFQKYSVTVSQQYFLTRFLSVVIFRTSNANQENITENAMSIIQRRRRKNNSSLNPDAALLVVPRPRPFSDISIDFNQDSSISPPLTPPLVGAKPPVSTMTFVVQVT